MEKIFGKNWKTTVAGIIVVGVGALEYFHIIPPESAKAIEILLVGLGLKAASDAKSN